MPFGSGRKSAAEWAHMEEIESDIEGHVQTLDSSN